MYEDYLMHHGILGQKWGIRRYQNLDGTLTAEGRKRYGNNIQAYSPIKLRRQVQVIDTMYGKGKNRRYRKAMNEWRDQMSKHGMPDRDTVERFVRNLAKSKLIDLGYTPSDEAVDFLKKQKWWNVPYAFLTDPTKKVMTFSDWYGV